MHYERFDTPLGALQRGLGRGFVQARSRHATEDVLACLTRDHRWFRSIDSRAIYLAKLVRGLEMPIGPLVDVLLDGGDAFDNILDVLVVLGRDDDPAAVDGLRRYVRDGPAYTDVLETIAREWSRPHWDDLRPIARNRLDAEPTSLFPGPPWTVWAETDPTIAARIRPRPGPGRRPPLDRTTEDLLASLPGGDTSSQRRALRELNRRGAHPELLEIAEHLRHDELAVPVIDAFLRLGAAALPTARAWAATENGPMRWQSWLILAEIGDETDLPALTAAWDWLDARRGDRCGYYRLAAGAARLGGHDLLPRIRRAWYSPHSYERAACLRAIHTLDPSAATKFLVEGLWDAETDVRTFAAEHVDLDERTRSALRWLHDDPLETPEVRAAAGTRL
ncbi:HEAT repeat domain-containing protein [Actinoplanes sp. HUAS TT8]|uniref:HEAT repeat domain-containing protein n=1 Tax=Actinoplanes sp. HUAS TT8 TaxID=3447453 RepID=UPI003F51FFE4